MRRTHWLLVEDNPAEAELARDALSATQLVDLTVAATGKDAIAYLHGGAERPPGPVSLVLLDANLPGMSGREVLSAIRAHPDTRATPVVMMSTSSESKDIADFYRLGANCYLVKPLSHREFMTMIAATTQYWLSVAQLPAEPEPR
jgi:CheY-like chemotaxis protein